MLYTSRTYAFIQPKKKRHLEDVIQHLDPQPHEAILEIGCGRGFLVKEVQAISPLTTGIDINREAVKNGLTNNLQVMNAECLDFQSNSFDKIYSFHTVEHIPNIKMAFEEMERILKPGGLVLLAYPAEPIRGLFALGAATILLKNPFKGRAVHLHKLSPSAIQFLVKGSTLQCLKSWSSFDPLPQYLTLLQKI